MVISLEQGADLHTAQLMPLPLTVSCFSKIQIGFTFLVACVCSNSKIGCQTQDLVIESLLLKLNWEF